LPHYFFDLTDNKTVHDFKESNWPIFNLRANTPLELLGNVICPKAEDRPRQRLKLDAMSAG
jgi:hypothetical protein